MSKQGSIMSRLLISLFFTFFSIALAATKDNKLATDSTNLACFKEQCRVVFVSIYEILATLILIVIL